MSRVWNEFLLLIFLDLPLIQKREKFYWKFKGKIQTIYIVFLEKIVTKIKHISIELTKAKPICSDLELAMVSPKRSMIPLIFNNN